MKKVNYESLELWTRRNAADMTPQYFDPFNEMSKEIMCWLKAMWNVDSVEVNQYSDHKTVTYMTEDKIVLEVQISPKPTTNYLGKNMTPYEYSLFRHLRR